MGKSIRSNFKKAIRAQRREQVKQEKVVVEAQRRRDEALAKCVAAGVSDLPLPLPVLPGMEIDGMEGAEKSKSKRKKHHKFLLPESKPTEDKDDEMADMSNGGQPGRSVMSKRKAKRKEKLRAVVGSVKKASTARNPSTVPKYGMTSMMKRVPRFSKTSKKS